MNIYESISKRRAIYPSSYTNENIEKEVIERILATANWAPTHRRTEPWRFHVFQDAAKMNLGQEILSLTKAANPSVAEFKLKKTADKFERSPVVMTIILHRGPHESVPEWEEVAAVAMAVQNMWLACTAEGLGAYWSSPGVIANLRDFLQLKVNEKCLGLFFIGKTNEKVEGSRKSSINDKITWCSE